MKENLHAENHPDHRAAAVVNRIATELGIQRRLGLLSQRRTRLGPADSNHPRPNGPRRPHHLNGGSPRSSVGGCRLLLPCFTSVILSEGVCPSRRTPRQRTPENRPNHSHLKTQNINPRARAPASTQPKPIQIREIRGTPCDPW